MITSTRYFTAICFLYLLFATFLYILAFGWTIGIGLSLASFTVCTPLIIWRGVNESDELGSEAQDNSGSRQEDEQEQEQEQEREQGRRENDKPPFQIEYLTCIDQVD